MPQKTDETLFEQAASLYKKTHDAFKGSKDMKGTKSEIIDHLSFAVFLLATINVKETKTSIDKTNELLDKNGMPELKITF